MFHHTLTPSLLYTSQNQDELMKLINAIGYVYGNSSAEKIMKLSEDELYDYTRSINSTESEKFIQNFLAKDAIPLIIPPTGSKNLFSAPDELDSLGIPHAIYDGSGIGQGASRPFPMSESNDTHLEESSGNTIFHNETTEVIWPS